MRLLTTICMILLFAITAFSQTTNPPDDIVGFIGASGDPNNGVASATADIGAAKLIGAGTYLGGVAHISKKADTPKFQLSTKIQLHLAQRLPINFGRVSTWWTAEVGPEFINALAAQASTNAASPAQSNTIVSKSQVGYAIGSGPLVDIPVGRHIGIAPHAEVTGGSLQDLGWRGGVLFRFGGGQ